MLKGRAWKPLLLSLLIAAAALYLTFRKTDWGSLLGTLGRIDLLPLLLVLPMLALSYVFRIQRWKILLRPVSGVSFREASAPLLTGFMVNSLLPGRVGEILRALLLSRKTDVPRAASFATVVVARLFDGLVLSAMALLLMGVMWRELDSTVRTGLVAVEEKIELILQTLKEVARVEFKTLLAPWKNKMHGVMTLLAGLELARQRAVTLRQSRLFSELWLLRRDLSAWTGEIPDAEPLDVEPAEGEEDA